MIFSQKEKRYSSNLEGIPERKQVLRIVKMGLTKYQRFEIKNSPKLARSGSLVSYDLASNPFIFCIEIKAMIL